MKNSIELDLKKIKELLKDVNIVRVRSRMFEDILLTLNKPHLNQQFRENGIEIEPGKFIKIIGIE